MARFELFDTPSAIVDLEIMDRNITQMVNRLHAAGIDHRPHIKAHKSIYIAKRQLAHGAKGITCAKLSEAQTMIDGGIKDILIANEIIGKIKLEKLMELSKRANITTVIDSLVGANGINDFSIKYNLVSRVLIDIDLGVHRTGLSVSNAVQLAEEVEKLENIEIVGVFGYSSLAYGKLTDEERIETTKQEIANIMQAKSALEESLKRPLQIISSGASYGSRFPEALLGLTESRAGNYVFNDAAALKAGVCELDDCALRIIATIISQPRPGELILDIGSKGLSSDGSRFDHLYGYVVEYPEMEIYKLNEEHAYVRYPENYQPEIGEKISIIPNHGCVISNLFGELIGVIDGEKVLDIAVEARGALR